MTEQVLAGRTAMIFGASGALGGAVSTALVESGAAVVGADRAIPDDTRKVSGVDYRAVDVLDDDGMRQLFDSLPQVWAVLNVVGGFAGQKPLSDLDPAALSNQLTLNLASAALVTKHSLRRM